MVCGITIKRFVHSDIILYFMFTCISGMLIVHSSLLCRVCRRGAWQWGMHGSGAVHGWGVHGWQGACMAGGMRGKGACVAGETATAADGTHPTGMHSCTYTGWEHTKCFPSNDFLISIICPHEVFQLWQNNLCGSSLRMRESNSTECFSIDVFLQCHVSTKIDDNSTCLDTKLCAEGINWGCTM